MGWPLRMFQEEGYYFVTSRCFQGRLLLRPSQLPQAGAGETSVALEAAARKERTPRVDWAELLRKTFGFDGVRVKKISS